jgi:ABC-type transporter Mla subunit MlaD
MTRLGSVLAANLLAITLVACGGGGSAEDEGLHYEVTASFERPGPSLEPGADVRIGGVNVGTVSELTEDHGTTEATLRIEPQFAPLSSNARAVVRQKTLLGETYIELTSRRQQAVIAIPSGGSVSNAQVCRALDAETCERLRRYRRQHAQD